MSQVHCGIQGFQNVDKEVQKVRLRKATYTIFEISQVDPVALQIVGTGGLDTSSDLRNVPTQEKLVETFEHCRKQLSGTKPSFIVYNFGYYNEKNSYREMMFLVSFIPESVDLRKKIAMTSNTTALQNSLQIPVHFEAHEMEDFEFERFKTECSTIQRK